MLNQLCFILKGSTKSKEKNPKKIYHSMQISVFPQYYRITKLYHCTQKVKTADRQTALFLFFAFSLPVDHFSEAGQDFTLPLPSFLLVEGRQGPLLVCTVDLVFLSQTHSLHTPMSAACTEGSVQYRGRVNQVYAQLQTSAV